MAILTRLLKKEKVAEAVAAVKEKVANVVSAMTSGISKKKLTKASCTAAAMSAMMTVAPVMCAINPDGISIEEIMGSVLGIIFTVAMYIGIILAIWGLFQLVMSLKNDDAEAKSRATQLMVVGIVLIGLKGLASVLLGKIGIAVVMPS